MLNNDDVRTISPLITDLQMIKTIKEILERIKEVNDSTENIYKSSKDLLDEVWSFKEEIQENKKN